MANLARSGRRLRAELLEDRRQLSAVTVTTHLDVVDAGDGLISLREAIQTTNGAAGADEIYFDAALNGQTIVLQSGQLQITDDLTINGPGADQLAISGNNKSRVLLVGSEGPTFSDKLDVTISGLTIKNGKHLAGAGIFSSENLTLVDSAVTNNVGSGGTVYFAAGGAGVLATGFGTPSTINITRSTISHNVITDPAYLAGPDISVGSRGYSGGGIYASGHVTVTDSVITDNVAGRGSLGARTNNPAGPGGYGGGLYASGDVTIQGSVISRNSAGEGNGQAWAFTGGAGGDGGGIAVFGSLAISDTLISENTSGVGGIGAYVPGDSGNGGGIYFQSFSPVLGGDGTLSVVDSSILDNRTAVGNPGVAASSGAQSGNGGGIWASGAVEIVDATIAGNSTGEGGAGFLSPFVSKSAGHAGNGGGVWLGGPSNKLILNSTISDNVAGRGGADVSGASAGNGGSGGGVWYEGVLVQNPSTLEITGELTIAHSTIASNSAGERGVQSPSGLGGGLRGQGGGVYNSIAAATITLSHSIVAGNFAGVDAPTDLTDLSGSGDFDAIYSLLGTNVGATIASSTGSQVGSPGSEIDPLLGPLADNGGPTQTRALLAGSPALDAGDATLTAGTGGTPEFDQRGTAFARIVGAKIDLGSFEAGESTPPTNADFDDNGFVDGADFLLWQRGEGDANDDEDSDGDDLQAWTETYGQATAPPPAAVTVEAFTAALLAEEDAAPEAEELAPTSWLVSLAGWSIAGGELAVKPAAVLLALNEEAHCLAFEQFRSAKTASLTTSVRLHDAFESLTSADEELPAEEAFELVLEGLF